MPTQPKQGKYTLIVPLDASGVEGFKPDQKVKVLVVRSGDSTHAVETDLDAKGRGEAVFVFDGNPGPLHVIIGPADAGDDEMQALQTIRHSVSARRWAEAPQLQLPVAIAPYYWWWWKRWCRDFVIRGRVLCPDGRPVPGANVCAYDVDGWWWWSSRQLAGCGVTDASGAFEIKFRWCCGWRPWWWWRRRVWHLEPSLIERILPVLQREPRIKRIPLPDPAPDIRIFQELLGEDEIALLNLMPLMSQAAAETTAAPHTDLAPIALVPLQSQFSVQPDLMPRLRERLVARLPVVPELEQLRIWPWWPWQPWWDCTPDILFRVTQNCGEGAATIVDEGYFDTRWNISTAIDVTLVANQSACCLADGDDEPQGSCALITNVCDNSIDLIGGNPGAPAAPVGYLSPGAVSRYGDRPYGGRVLLQGQVGSDVDYYEFEWSADGGASWSPMPGSAVGDIPRRYWIPVTNTFQSVPFLHSIDSRLVFESRQHYEATHDPASWGVSRFWMANNYLSLMNWLTATPFMNGTYQLRMIGWQFAGGHLTNSQVLNTCNTQNPASVVLRIDNRLVGSGSGHPPSTPSHPCGDGTVHTCTLEPDTDFVAVRIIHADASVTQVGACGNVPIGANDVLEVDFYAHDPEGHLAYYTLRVTYGENLAVNLLDPADVPSLTLPGFGLAPYGGTPVPAAAQVGPTYAAARLDGASPPTWAGGGIRLRVKAVEAFPETCCYQLELRAHKRTIVGCDHSLWNHVNFSEYSFMVVV